MQSTADAIHDALTMDAETKKSNHEKLWKVSLNRVGLKLMLCLMQLLLLQYVSTHTSEKWGTDFVSERELHPCEPAVFAIHLLNLDI